MIATAPGKLILTGEYAVLDGAPALVVAVDRRVIARRRTGPRGSSPFLLSVADELARRFGPDHPATKAAFEIVVDSQRFFLGQYKLGIGSSAAVTVAATALALASLHDKLPVIDRDTILSIATAAHASARTRRLRDSGAHMIIGQRRPGTRDSGAHLDPHGATDRPGARLGRRHRIGGARRRDRVRGWARSRGSRGRPA